MTWRDRPRVSRPFCARRFAAAEGEEMIAEVVVEKVEEE